MSVEEAIERGGKNVEELSPYLRVIVEDCHEDWGGRIFEGWVFIEVKLV